MIAPQRKKCLIRIIKWRSETSEIAVGMGYERYKMDCFLPGVYASSFGKDRSENESMLEFSLLLLQWSKSIPYSYSRRKKSVTGAPTYALSTKEDRKLNTRNGASKQDQGIPRARCCAPPTRRLSFGLLRFRKGSSHNIWCSLPDGW